MLVILVIIVLILDNKNLLLLYKKDAKLNQQQFSSINELQQQQVAPQVYAPQKKDGGLKKKKKQENYQGVDNQQNHEEDIQNEGGSEEDDESHQSDNKIPKGPQKSEESSQEEGNRVYEGILPQIHTAKSLKDEKKKKKKKKQVLKKKSTENQGSSEASGSENSNDNGGNYVQTKGELDESVNPQRYDNHLQVLDESDALDKSEDQFMSSAKVLNINEMNNNHDEGGVVGIQQKSNPKEVVAAQQSKGFMNRTSTKSLKPLFFKDIFYLTMKTYNKVTGIFYAETPYLPRALKVLGSIVQIIIMLCLTGVFSVSVQINGYSGSIFLPILVLKVINIIFHCMISRSILKSKALCRNICAGCIQFAMLIGVHIWALMIAHNADDSLMTIWQHSFVAVFFIELLPIEFLCLPLLIRLYIKYKKGGRNDLSPAFKQQL